MKKSPVELIGAYTASPAGTNRSASDPALACRRNVPAREMLSERSISGVHTRFDYRDDQGKICYSKIRFDPEVGEPQFNWLYGFERGHPPIPYRLDELVQDAESVIVMAEGEKVADYLVGQGFLASSSADLPESLPWLKARTVAILPNNSKDGAFLAKSAKRKIEQSGGKAFIVALPDLPENGSVCDWPGQADDIEREIVHASRPKPTDLPERINATPFDWPDPTNIPPRQWLFGRWLLRGEVTAVVAPGGVGKSTLISGLALSIASGDEFLGKRVWEGPRTVWVWNFEDDKYELKRSLSACALFHEIGPENCSDRLFVDSGMDQRFCTAIDDGDGFKIIEPVYELLKAEITRRGVDVLTVDPFVKTHKVDENANSLIDKIADRWKQLAHDTGSSIVLVHHTKKMGTREVKAEDGRGAVALINVARSTLVINQMTSDEAERFGISDMEERRSIVRVDDDKPNRAPAEKAWWMKKQSVPLNNSDRFQRTDDVGAATNWTPPDPFQGISLHDLYEVQTRIRAGNFGSNPQANDWAGKVVAEVIGGDLEDPKEKARIKSLLRTWTSNGSFKVEKRKTDKGREKPFLVVKNAIEKCMLPTLESGVGASGKVG